MPNGIFFQRVHVSAANSVPADGPTIDAGLAPSPGTAARPARKRSILRRPALRRPAAWLALVAALVAVLAYADHWWTVGRFLETTDDAYLQADNVTVAPRIAGYVAEVLVGDNQPVTAGEVIARLDDREYRVALKQAQAEVEKDKADLQGAAAAIIQQQAQIEQARAEVENTEAALTFSSLEFTRYQNLVRSGSGTVQRQQQADADLRQRRAARDKAKASFDAAEKQV